MAAPLSFFGTPLGPARAVPVTTVTRPAPVKRALPNPSMPAAAGPSKRPKPSSASSSPAKKRSKLQQSVEAVRAQPQSVREPITPQPSSDGPAPANVTFKIPALPARLAPLTPTTSTVAASSSPRRLSSSPTRNTAAAGPSALARTRPAPPVRLEAGTTLVFGRHHVRGARSDVGPPPPALAGKLATSNPARTIILDRAAKHASRVHAAAELLPSPTSSGSMIRLVVLGQNGLRVRTTSTEKFRRLTPGTIRTFPADTVLEIDFYGAAISLRAFEDPDETDDENAVNVNERLFTPEPEAEGRAPSPMSLPPSSPPRMDIDSMSDGESEAEMRVPASDEAAPTPFASRVAAPLPDLARDQREERSSSPLSEIDEPAVEAPAPSTEALAVKQELFDAASSIAATTAPSLPSPFQRSTTPIAAPPPSRAKTPAARSRAATPAPPSVPPVPSGLDLPALLASTVVFSGSSKLSLPDLVKSLLESQPNLREHGEATWTAWAAAELESNDMFGKITRNGRDASGRPLQPHYFYNPAADPDAARARELGGLVRPLRATQRGGGRAIDWRPVGPGRRRY